MLARVFEESDAQLIRTLGGIPILNSMAAADTFDLRVVAEAPMRGLRDQLGESVHGIGRKLPDRPHYDALNHAAEWLADPILSAEQMDAAAAALRPAERRARLVCMCGETLALAP